MDYEQFITEIQKYWDLREKGLKKQANSFLFTFTKFLKRMCRMRIETLSCSNFAGNTWMR